jgi:hypothetical protein
MIGNSHRQAHRDVGVKLPLPCFEQAVLKLDVGHAGQAQVELLHRARTLIMGLLPAFGLHRSCLRVTRPWHSELIRQIDSLLARCWEVAAMDFLADVYAMTDLQRKELLTYTPSMDAGHCFDRFTHQLLESRTSAVKYLGVSITQTGINGANRCTGQFMVHVTEAPSQAFSGSSYE